MPATQLALGLAVAVDAAGNSIVVGSFRGTMNLGGTALTSQFNDRVDFGGGPITGGRSDDLFVLTLGPDGQHLCSRRYGSASGSSSALGLALHQDGNALVAGALSGTVDFGNGALTSTGGVDIILAKFNSDPMP